MHKIYKHGKEIRASVGLSLLFFTSYSGLWSSNGGIFIFSSQRALYSSEMWDHAKCRIKVSLRPGGGRRGGGHSNTKLTDRCLPENENRGKFVFRCEIKKQKKNLNFSGCELQCSSKIAQNRGPSFDVKWIKFE